MKTLKTTTIEIIYVADIESALKEYTKEGYVLESHESLNEVEIRFHLRHPDKSNICLARQFWDEMYPETIDECSNELPENYKEIWTHSIQDYNDVYLQLKSLNLVDTVPNDDLTDVAGLRIKNSTTRIVHLDGYTWE